MDWRGTHNIKNDTEIVQHRIRNVEKLNVINAFLHLITRNCVKTGYFQYRYTILPN